MAEASSPSLNLPLLKLHSVLLLDGEERSSGGGGLLAALAALASSEPQVRCSALAWNCALSHPRPAPAFLAARQ